MIVKSISDPLNFQREFNKRQEKVIEKLKQIRSAEQMYYK